MRRNCQHDSHFNINVKLERDCKDNPIQQPIAHSKVIWSSSQAQRATVQQHLFTVQLKLKETHTWNDHKIGAILKISYC